MRFITFEKTCVDVDEGKLLDKDGDVDCFVNGTNANLEHICQVSKMLREARGDSYERECKEVRSRMRKLKTPQCLVAKTGDSFTTRHVIYVACPAKKTEVFDMISNCLETATEKQFKSVALAFLSSGSGHFDIQFCSKTRKNIFLVENICFIDKNPEKVKVVIEMFEKIIPNDMRLLFEVPTQYFDECPRLGSTAENVKTNAIRDEAREEPAVDCGSAPGSGDAGCHREKCVGDDPKAVVFNFRKFRKQHYYEECDSNNYREYGYYSDVEDDLYEKTICSGHAKAVIFNLRQFKKAAYGDSPFL